MLKAQEINCEIDGMKFLSDVTTQFPTGSINIISGNPGSGKSLLFSILSGVYFPDDGDVLINGKSLFNSSREDKIILRKHFGVIFQRPSIISNLSVSGNLRLTAKLHHKDSSEEELEHLIKEELAEFDLLSLENKRPSSLSQGQLFSLAVVRSFLCRPKIFLWDEPLVHLDDRFHNIVLKKIFQLKAQGNTILFFSNKREIINNYGDHVFRLDQGELQCQ
jgi:ABC-2 type transport system ATP-binding protein